jgi:hypothetical protein
MLSGRLDIPDVASRARTVVVHLIFMVFLFLCYVLVVEKL